MTLSMRLASESTWSRLVDLRLVMSVVILSLKCHNLCWVILSYSLGGTALGSFESNLLNCLTPFGHRTKSFAILGIPLGVNSILIGGFFFMGPPLELPVTAIFASVALMNLLAMCHGDVLDISM